MEVIVKMEQKKLLFFSRKQVTINGVSVREFADMQCYTSIELARMARGHISVPKRPSEYNIEEYIYWHVFRICHLGIKTNVLSRSVVMGNLERIKNTPIQKIIGIMN